MSSNCSINCCSSPEVTSSNVSGSNMNGVISNDTAASRIRTTVPDTKKDNKYWERRRRNNEAARRSREKRRQNDMVMDKRILELSQRNKQLENELFQLKMNFGLVNNNPSKLELDDSTNKLVSPTTVNEVISNNNNSADHINGMVFPVFTAFPPSTEIPEIIDKVASDNTNKPLTNNKQNENPKTCINNTTKYPSNLISIGNIPFLSNLISSPNFNEDITTKATLLLPSLVSKSPIKSVDPGQSSGSFSNNPNTVVTVDGLTFNGVSEPSNDCNKRSVNVDATQKSSIGNRLKLDFHDILDLSVKQENNECFFINEDRLPEDLNEISESNEENKDGVIIRSSPENQSIEESMTNSFLSGIVSTNCKERLSIGMKRKSSSSTSSFVNTNSSNRLNNSKFRRCNIFNDDRIGMKCQGQNKWHFNAIRHNLNLKTRLHIRREVSTIVINENRKLRQDIDCLSTEIKLLKAAMFECAKFSVSKSLPNHHSSSINEVQLTDKLSVDNDGALFIQCTP